MPRSKKMPAPRKPEEKKRWKEGVRKSRWRFVLSNRLKNGNESGAVTGK